MLHYAAICAGTGLLGFAKLSDPENEGSYLSGSEHVGASIDSECRAVGRMDGTSDAVYGTA